MPVSGARSRRRSRTPAPVHRQRLAADIVAFASLRRRRRTAAPNPTPNPNRSDSSDDSWDPMDFLSPIRLVLLAVPAALLVAYVVAQRVRRKYAVRFTSVELLASVAPRRPGWQRHVPTVAMLFALGRARRRFRSPDDEGTDPPEGRERGSRPRHVGLDGRDRHRPQPADRGAESCTRLRRRSPHRSWRGSALLRRQRPRARAADDRSGGGRERHRRPGARSRHGDRRCHRPIAEHDRGRSQGGVRQDGAGRGGPDERRHPDRRRRRPDAQQTVDAAAAAAKAAGVPGTPSPTARAAGP